MGLFGGKKSLESLHTDSYLNVHPRFTGENWEKNKAFFFHVDLLAKKYGCTPAQLALAWVHHQGDDVVSIPGTTEIKHLAENIGSLNIKLTRDEVKELSDAVPIEEVAGNTHHNAFLAVSWRFANTPQPKSNEGFGVLDPWLKLVGHGHAKLSTITLLHSRYSMPCFEL